MAYIDKEIFDKPSGNVRGVIVGFLTTKKGREQRAFHAYVFTDKDPDISMYVVRNVSLNVLSDYAKLTTAFVKSVSDEEYPF